MKKTIKFLAGAAVAALTVVSCSQELEPDNANKEQTPDENAITIKVHASADEIKSDDPEVKTYLGTYQGQENTVLWGTGEYMKLAVTAGETTHFATSDEADANGSPSATFSFSVDAFEGNPSSYTYQGLYPASAAASDNKNAANYKVNLPAIQNATASSYDPAAYIMVAKPESFASVQTDWEASFRRGTALNKITLKNFASSVSINKVKITAEGKHLAGGHHINLTTGENCEGSTEYYNSEATIEVRYASPLIGTSMDVWFTSWNAELTEGDKLTVVAYTTDNKTYTKEITLASGKTIKFLEGYLNTLGAKFDGIDPVNVSSLDGNYVILAENSGNYYALKGEASGTRIASVNYTGSTSSYAGDASIIWTIATSGSGYTIKNGSNFIGWTSSNSADLVDENDYDATKCLMGIDDNGDGTYKIYVATSTDRILARNQSNAYFAFYTGSGYKDLILVPATAKEQVATPTFSPAAGEVASGDQVTISCATSGATIHYTVDGTDPTSSSAAYSSPIEITATTTIKAIAVMEGKADSEIATATYTVAGAGSVTLTSSDITAGDNTVQGTNSSALAYRLGTGSNNGSLTFPAGYSTITFTLAGWASGTRSFSITNGTINSSASLSPDAGSPSGTINADFSTSYEGTEYTIVVTDPTQAVVFSGRRAVVWGFTATAAGPAITWNLESISITTPPTKTEYTEGETFDPTGMVVTGHFVDADDNTNTKDEAVTGYTISPNGALTESDTQVTITYQGETTNQTITVTAASTPSGAYYEKVTSTLNDYSGEYLIVDEDSSLAATGEWNSTKGIKAADIIISNSKVESNSTTNAYSATISKLTGTSNYTVYFNSTSLYLGYTGSSNESRSYEQLSGDNTSWTISISNGAAVLTNVSENTRVLRSNYGTTSGKITAENGPFRCYTGSTGYAAVLYKLSDSRADAGMSWSSDNATATYTTGNTLSFTAPTLTAGNATGITYESTDETIATINASGVVTITALSDNNVKEGSTTIKAIFAGDTNYKPQTVSYTLNVVDSRAAVATPTFNPAAGEVAANTTVNFQCADSDVTYHYTVNGSNPTVESPTAASVTIDAVKTVKVLATKTGYKPSAIATAAYTVAGAQANDGTLEHPYSASEARTLALGGDTGSYYIYGTITKIQNQYSAGYGTANFWIDENGTSDSVFEGYKIKYFGNQSWVTGNAELALNDEVIIYGTLTVYNSTTPETSSGYLVSLNGKTKGLTLAAPTITTNDSAKQITVAWTSATGTESAVSYVITCGTQSHNASAAGSHTFTMGDYGTYNVSVAASASDAISATVTTSATLVDPNAGAPTVYEIQWGSAYNGKSVSSYTESWNATKDGFTVNMANFNNNNNGWSYVKCGRKNTASVATIITDAVIPEAISNVTITIDALTASKINSITLYVSSSKTSGWTSAGTFTKATGEQSVTIASPATNKYYKIEFDCAGGSSNGLLTLSKAVFSNN